MKLTITAFFLAPLLTLRCFAQSDYDGVRVKDIVFENIALSDLQAILKKIDHNITKKVYTPPPGDTEEYDKIHYYENNDIKLKLYESSGNLSLSSMIVKTDKYELGVLGNTFKIGSSESMFSMFQKSFDMFTKQQSNTKIDREVQFHLNVIHPNGAEGILTIKVKNKLVTQISISLNPA